MQASPLYISITTLLLGVLTEFVCLNIPFAWSYKKYLASVSMLLMAFGAGILIAEKPSLFSIVLLFVTAYKVVNNLRIVENRMHEEHLKKVAKRTSYVLTPLQIILTILVIANISINYKQIAPYYAAIVFVISVALLANTLYWIKISAIRRIKKHQVSELPTVTLAIPARNEDYALKTCLEAAIASDYQKLEIIVIDDCSQDKTPKIIQQFAHDGVRFVQASEAGKSWLAKNKADQTLFEQASGQIIMFIGVDVSLSPQTISKLIDVFISKKCKMLSVMPSRTRGGLVASLIQPMRYWREFSIPKQVKRRSPVLSTCWLIKKSTLKEIGGFKSVARTIVPEEHFAKILSPDYIFRRDSNSIGLTTQKDFYSQWETAVRTHYPAKHKKPESVMLDSLLMIFTLILPYIAIFWALANSLFLTAIILLSTCMCLTLTNLLINLISNKSAVLLSVINFPFVALLDLAALNISMYKYEFSEVNWRGRNITAPTMHVYAHLPKIS